MATTIPTDLDVTFELLNPTGLEELKQMEPLFTGHWWVVRADSDTLVVDDWPSGECARFRFTLHMDAISCFDGNLPKPGQYIHFSKGT
jgi:hypothetical protein